MRFHKIYVEISDICKLSCSFCTPKKAVRTTMPLSLFEKIISQIAKHTKLVSLHALGDPLVVENLSAYIDIGAYYNVMFDIVSSGAFLRHEHFMLLTRTNIHQVSFSLDALFDNAHIRKDIHAYFDTIIAFYRYAHTYAPSLYINLRLFNDYDYTYFLRYFPNAIRQMEKRRIRLAKNFFLRFHKAFTWHTSMQHTRTDTAHCLGSIKQLAILANGIVTPCCIDVYPLMPLGDFTMQSFTEILQGHALKAMQHAQRTHTNLPPPCQNCTFRGI